VSALQQSINKPEELDIKSTISSNRLLGLWRLMRGFRLQYVGANVALGISATSKTLTYLLLRYFIDDILAPGKYNLIPLAALGFVLLALFEGSTTFISGTLAASTAEGVTRRLRNYLFDHLQRLPFKYHSETSTGELIERCTSDVDAIRRFFADQAINVGRIVLLFVINFAALYSLNARLALLSIIVVPFILVTSIIFFARITKAYEAYQEQEAVLSTTIQENLTGVRVVKAYARQEFEINKFEKENALKFAKGKTLMKMHSLFWPISDTFCGFQILAGFFLGAQMVINGTLTIGSYLAYAGLIVWLIFPLRTLGRVIVQMSTGLVSYTRVMKIIKEDREQLDAGTISPDQVIHGDIKFENVSFEYEKDNPILLDVSFECTSGQSVALLGSTGSGKTSLVNLLPRFYDVTSGAVYLDGRNINDYPIHYLREQIGIVEQEPFLFSRTIRENIVYGVDRVVSDEEVYEAARAAAIHDVILSFPQGYATLVGEKGVTLSGGQKQRVTIARTLLKNPRILVLDDSTSSVDLETEAEIRQALENLMKNRTTFIIAHRIQSIMNADLILVFDKGGIIQRGTHKQLIGVPGVYQQIYELQTNIDMELEKEVSRVRL
jgi:ATP-binding cassette, subfamily B, bacterial